MKCARKGRLAGQLSLSACAVATAVFASAFASGCVTGDELDAGLVDAANDQYFRGTTGFPSAVAPVPSAPGGAQSAAPLPGFAQPPLQSEAGDEEIPADALTLEQWLAGARASAPE